MQHASLAGGILGGLGMFRNIGAWLPFVLIAGATYLTGFLMSMLPGPGAEKKA